MKTKRRTFSPEFKAKVGLEAIKEVKTISELSQKYQVHPNQLSMWKKEFLAHASMIFEHGHEDTEQIQKLQREKESLVQQIGQLTVDINWLKKKLL